MDPLSLNPNHLDLADASEVALYADALGISVERLREIAERVGPMRPSIRFYAIKSANERKSPAKDAAIARAA